MHRVALLVLGLCWLAPQAGWAADDDVDVTGSLRECVDSTLARAVEHEAVRLLEAPRQEFLLAGDVRVHAHELARADCLGFLAVGAKYVQDIDLTVQSADGTLLARAETPGATPYVHYCGKAGEQVFVTLRLLDGQGEVAYAALSHAGLQVGALAGLAQCPWIGAPRPPALDVGPEPQARSISDELRHVTAELGPLGYRPARMVGYGTLRSAQHETRGLALESDRCYALVGAGSRDVVDLDLRLFGPALSDEPLFSDTTRKRDALVKLCPPPPGRYLLDMAVFQGEGAYAVQAYELQETSAELPPGVEGQARIAYEEMRRRLHDRGMQPEPLNSGVVRPGEALAVPVSVRAGECYALAVIGATERRSAGFELALTDALGDLLAYDTAARRDPMLFHCPKTSQLLRASVRTRDAREPAHFVLLLGREQASAAKGPVL